ncbi:MAG: SGNH/GDSL hydrolase family protein [Thermoguttaceae bacterium]|jgi:lysophospholipase L1-like esterase|nr:SGNH/GDSL hydrolase family protein [Thermoguttaceae bacterium]
MLKLTRLNHSALIALAVLGFLSSPGAADQQKRERLLRESQTIVFLGDSITFGGNYVACFDAWLLTQKLEPAPLVINAGLASETVSGLSEEGHADGRFPRPDLAERLDRVLTLTRPDLVFACYGINCGIYEPLDEERFRRYRKGIEQLKRKVETAGATLVLVTPPSYDDQRKKGPFSYNAVLDHYADWLLAPRTDGWLVVDLHGPMTAELARRRQADPDFTLQPDAVHPNDEGHWFMARQLIRWFGDAEAAGADSPEAMLEARGISPDAMKLIRQRMAVLRDAYVAAAGHKRPGVRAGLPVPDALDKARELLGQIRELAR